MSEADRNREAWERMPEEGAKAFRAFQLYYELPPEKRSLLEVSRKYYGRPDASRPGGRISEWSRLFHWNERATLRDAWLDDLRRDAEARKEAERAEAWAARRIEVREEAWGLAMGLMERAREILEMPLTQRKESKEIIGDGEIVEQTIIIEPLGVRARDAALIGKVAVEMARVAAGLAAGQGLMDADFSNLSDDELRAIAAGRSKPAR